jgi:DNA-binding CsgD family transcriptional regulator/pimeloyl-ACP methyl ester carboxylesterase
MEPPPLQYVTTPDGFEIAYTVAGGGLPFVFMPWPFSNMSQIWHTKFGRPMLESLVERFKLVQYDSRGQGMSTRVLPEYHSRDDYVTDLETVVDRLDLDRFVLYGAVNFTYAAVSFAVRHPERVHALVLGDVSIERPASMSGFVDMARTDWDTFLHAMVSSYSLEGAPPELPYWRDSITREDYLRMSSAHAQSTLIELLPQVRVPTLILNTRRLRADEPVHALAEQSRAIAALIPGARLVLFDGFASIWYSDGPEPPRAVRAIEDFVGDLGLVETVRRPEAATAGALSATLSLRETEILRLIARGRSNQEIAAELVLSVRTVERHITNLYGKIGARRKADATAFALRTGLA